jgi:phage-related holin
MQSAMGKKSSFKRILKYLFGGLSLVFIAILVFMVVHDIITGESSNTAEYCSKYGFLASPGCW